MLGAISVVLVITIYFLCCRLFNFWDRRNVFNVKFEFTFQTFIKIFIKNEHVQDFFADLYRKYKSHGMVGFYALHTPMLLVTDPELVKTVLVKDFNKFTDTSLNVKKETDPMFVLNPLSAKGTEEWKELRGIQASNMTTARLKKIVPIMHRIAENMVNYLTEKKMEPIAAKELTFLYTVDNACSFGFGLEPRAFTDPENSFMKYEDSQKIFNISPICLFCHLFLPKIANVLKLRIWSKDAEEFFKEFVQKIIDNRSRYKATNYDFISHIIKLNHKLKEENKQAFTIQEVAAYCLTFYEDSTDASSSQLAFFLLDLANNQDVQDKLRKEISSISTSPTDFHLEKINSLEYLNMAINESLRLHTQSSWLTRCCTTDTVLGNAQIPKGTSVFIPAGPLHKDPAFFPDPERFNPERFSPENKESIPKYTFLPFGEGPRICVGFKFALLQIKMGVIFLLLNFKILPSGDDKKEAIEIDNAPFLTPRTCSKLKFIPLIQDASH